MHVFWVLHTIYACVSTPEEPLYLFFTVLHKELLSIQLTNSKAFVWIALRPEHGLCLLQAPGELFQPDERSFGGNFNAEANIMRTSAG